MGIVATVVGTVLAGGAAFVAAKMFVALQLGFQRAASRNVERLVRRVDRGVERCDNACLYQRSETLGRRSRSSRRCARHLDALAVAISIKAPGVSYLFVWSALFVAVALVAPRFETPATWIAAVATLLLFPGLVYGASIIMLGVVGAGAIALGVLTALIVALLAPLTCA